MTAIPLEIKPISHPLDAVVRVPGSKSLTNRALLLASLANGTTRLINALFSDDSYHFSNALKALGFDIQLDQAAREMTVTGRGGEIPARKADLFIGNAGTAARFLTAMLTLGSGEYILNGDERMRQRPMGGLVTALIHLGSRLEMVDDCPPVRISADGLPGGRTSLPGDISSQFLSALLMVAPYANNPIEIELSTEMNSRPYVDMTISMMEDFGVQVERDGYRSYKILPAKYEARESYSIESDASAASYFFAAPAICGGKVRVQDISRESRQGDIAFLDVLEEMGCRVRKGEASIEVSGADSLKGVEVDMRDISDTAQTLAAIAPFAGSSTRIRGIASARVKETDRIRATCSELGRLGVRVEEHTDGMIIHPGERFRPAAIQTYNDHRMAMAFSLIGLRIAGVSIENPACVSKTFPDFFDVLDSLR